MKPLAAILILFAATFASAQPTVPWPGQPVPAAQQAGRYQLLRNGLNAQQFPLSATTDGVPVPWLEYQTVG